MDFDLQRLPCVEHARTGLQQHAVFREIVGQSRLPPDSRGTGDLEAIMFAVVGRKGEHPHAPVTGFDVEELVSAIVDDAAADFDGAAPHIARGEVDPIFEAGDHFSAFRGERHGDAAPFQRKVATEGFTGLSVSHGNLQPGIAGTLDLFRQAEADLGGAGSGSLQRRAKDVPAAGRGRNSQGRGGERTSVALSGGEVGHHGLARQIAIAGQFQGRPQFCPWPRFDGKRPLQDGKRRVGASDDQSIAPRGQVSRQSKRAIADALPGHPREQ